MDHTADYVKFLLGLIYKGQKSIDIRGSHSHGRVSKNIHHESLQKRTSC